MLSTDMASVRTGERGTTVREAELHHIAAALVALRIGQRNRSKQETMESLQPVLQQKNPSERKTKQPLTLILLCVVEVGPKLTL